MTQDTRKDRRVKIVSLNVRYKSATVDEFIENHAHDVSRGGIYIKTTNPFPQGTLLKFEIRLASDQAVIAGVGRVVWKRDADVSNGDRPAGMGVKFIKVDDPSKTVIDKLMNTRADAGRAYESEVEPALPPADAAHVSSQPPRNVTQPPRGSTSPPRSFTPPARTPAPSASSPPKEPAVRTTTKPSVGVQPLVRRSTIVGLGMAPTIPPAPRPASATSTSPPPSAARKTPFPATPAAPPRPNTTAGAMFPSAVMFPTGDSDDGMGEKQEQTVMKQAAELLEEALREAGGSMDEVGTNPLFAGSGGMIPPREPAHDAEHHFVPLGRAVDGPAASAPNAAEEWHAKSRLASGRPGSTVARESEPWEAPKKKRGGVIAFLVLVVVGAAGVAGATMYRRNLFGSSPATRVEAVPQERPAPEPTAVIAPSQSAGPVTSAIASARAQPAGSERTTLAADAAFVDAQTASASASPRTPAVAAPATVAPTPKAVAPPAQAVAPPAPTPSPPPTATAVAAPPKPAPAPKPKATKPPDDNPY